MYDERLEKLLFRLPSADLERHAANDHEPNVGLPELPPPRNPSEHPWDDRRDPDDLGPMRGILLAEVLAIIFWLALFGIVAGKLI